MTESSGRSYQLRWLANGTVDEDSLMAGSRVLARGFQQDPEVPVLDIESITMLQQPPPLTQTISFDTLRLTGGVRTRAVGPLPFQAPTSLTTAPALLVVLLTMCGVTADTAVSKQVRLRAASTN